MSDTVEQLNQRLKAIYNLLMCQELTPMQRYILCHHYYDSEFGKKKVEIVDEYSGVTYTIDFSKGKLADIINR